MMEDNKRRYCWPAALLVAVAFGATGCGGPGYPAARLAGIITLDGVPVPEGYVQFTPQEGGRGPVVAARIVQGKYDARDVPLGKVRVRFRAIVETDEMEKHPDNDLWAPKRVDLIPPQYAGGVEIEVSGDKLDQDFALSGRTD
jgi:hypothetical protein